MTAIGVVCRCVVTPIKGLWRSMAMKGVLIKRYNEHTAFCHG